MFIKQLKKGNNYPEMGNKFVVGASTGCEKINSAATDDSFTHPHPLACAVMSRALDDLLRK